MLPVDKFMFFTSVFGPRPLLNAGKSQGSKERKDIDSQGNEIYLFGLKESHVSKKVPAALAGAIRDTHVRSAYSSDPTFANPASGAATIGEIPGFVIRYFGLAVP